ncbi:MAG: Benzoyl-CoA oxygenase component B [Alphaproteobacteria bacterium MarineAlpha9_Bin4]|nr:benzoyl-CoA 2,3-epoxidase subunit BoxB [Pelagibacterales bacterium]PPR26548.1 MAG: Benzoyl-CoA oxygenase component B [Alphaproteobacteria bacterium MarineAlpha9_Bin4]|tara:strand:- start:291 stop:1718 length:1428 start_codon:yes stop_codon:yes gene_type:complete
MSKLNYQERIPNNVDLSNDLSLQRALEHWQPKFKNWWQEMGPEGFQGNDVYLRTAISVDTAGWASYGKVKMPDYRWGIFLADPVKDKKIHFGDSIGKPVWQEVPGDYRSILRRLIVTQGDTEPASVEQQRLLGKTCPSLFDLRNLFQVNVEEGRHLWAMVYLLHAYFGRDGREEAEALLERNSGDEDNPRILGTFNEPISDWVSFYMFTYFTDRDGKYQLKSLAESSFDPLARTCQFMLTEEAHHMQVGESGITRMIERTLEVMKQLKTDSVDAIRNAGAIDLPTIQKYINFWFSSSLDLFGSEISTNAATAFANGLKGRPDEFRFKDHSEKNTFYKIENFVDNKIVIQDIPMRNAMNEITRVAYVDDCNIGVKRWNRLISKNGYEDFTLSLPSTKFRRSIGIWSNLHVDPRGNLLDNKTYNKQLSSWLPSEQDKSFIKSLMKQELEPGKVASWIANPRRGINNNDISFKYVDLN